MFSKILLLAASAAMLCLGLCGCDDQSQYNANADKTEARLQAGLDYQQKAIGFQSLPAFIRLKGTNICVTQKMSDAACAEFSRRVTEQESQIMDDLRKMGVDLQPMRTLHHWQPAAVIAATLYLHDAKRLYEDSMLYCNFLAYSAGEESFLPPNS